MKAFGFNCMSREHMFNDDPVHLVPMENKCSSLMSAENPTGKCFFHLQRGWLRVQLHGGGESLGIQNKYARCLTDSVAWDSLSDHYAGSSNENEKEISLKGFKRQALGICAVKAFFGKELFELFPTFWSQYQDFEDASWKVFYNYPRRLARGLHEVNDHALDHLINYLTLPAAQRSGLAWLFQTMDTELTSLDLDPEARTDAMIA